jgi:WD40 repeat protein
MMEMFDAETGEAVMEPFGHEGQWVRSIAFSSDGQQIVSGANKDVSIYDASTGKCVGSSSGEHEGLVISVKMALHGQQIASGDGEGIVRVWGWNAVEGVLATITLFDGHQRFVNSLTFSPDGKHIACGYSEGMIRLWDLEKGIASMQRHEGRDDYDLYNKPVNGWVRCTNSKLLYWIPPKNRLGLWNEATTWVIGKAHTKLDFSAFVHGRHWTSCYTPTSVT